MSTPKTQRRQHHPAEAADPSLLPRNPATGEPLPQTAEPGYYPGFSTLSQSSFWEDATRDVVNTRVEKTPAIRWFSPEQAAFWRAVFEHLIPQADRVPERRIPIVEPLDARLYENRTIGYRFENMPPDREAFALGEQAINEEARHRFGGDFIHLPVHDRDIVLKALHDSKPEAAKAIWKRMSVGRFWQLLMQDALEAYYAHPWAWDEVGFGGPAYPRAYTRLERGEPEPWEVEEQRYAWKAPADTVSDVSEATHHLHLEVDQIDSEWFK